MKRPAINRPGTITTVAPHDRCQTPGYALDPLLPYIPPGVIWEPAAGEGNLVNKLALHGHKVIATDLLTGSNFFTTEPRSWHVQITNPPYSTKYEWIQHSYDLGKPWALLMPFYTWAARGANKLFEKQGIEVIIINPRINFKMPNKGYSGSGAHIATAWFTWGFDIGATVTYATVTAYPDGQQKLPVD